MSKYVMTWWNQLPVRESDEVRKLKAERDVYQASADDKRHQIFMLEKKNRDYDEMIQKKDRELEETNGTNERFFNDLTRKISECADMESQIDKMQDENNELWEQLVAAWKVITEQKADLTKWEEREVHDDQDRETFQRRLTKVIAEKQELERNIDKRHENVLSENMFLSNENSDLKNKLRNLEMRLNAIQAERQEYKDTQEQNDMLLKENIYISEQSQEMKDEILLLRNKVSGLERENKELRLMSRRATDDQEKELEKVQNSLTQKTLELNWYKDHNLQRALEVLRVQTVRVTRYGKCFHLWKCQALKENESKEYEMCGFCASDLYEKHRIMLSNREHIWPSGSASSD